MAKRKQTVSVSLDNDQLLSLDEIVKETKIPRSVLVQEAVRDIIAKYQPQLKLQLPPTLNHQERQ